MKARNDFERLADALAGLVVGNECEEDHLTTCKRMTEAAKLLKKVAPERLATLRFTARSGDKLPTPDVH